MPVFLPGESQGWGSLVGCRLWGLSSVAQLCLTLCGPWIVAHQASLSITNSRSSPKLMSTESEMPTNHFILCCLLLLLASVFLSIRVFSIELTLQIRWPKYWSFSFSISLSNESSEFISFRINWFGLLAVQGENLKSLFQHHTSKASIIHAHPSLWFTSHICLWLLEKP